jgi:hypothetical protein
MNFLPISAKRGAITTVLRSRIFIHSNWRSGGTYFWSKFRLNPVAYGFYEPLFEGLASASVASIFLDRSATLLGHTLTAPSKLEYLPLLTEGGVIDFAGDSYGGYFLSPGDKAPELQAYFSRLTRFADENRRVPVFGMVRSGSRIGWFKARFGGCHVAIRRSPRHRWISYLRRAAQGDTYFIERGPIIIGRNRGHPALEGLIRLLGLTDPGRTREDETSYRDMAYQLGVPRLYVIFAYLDRLHRIEAECHADLVIDLDHVTSDPEAARDAETIIAQQTGFEVSLGDCVLPRYDDVLSRWSSLYDRIDAHIDQALTVGSRGSRAVVS